MGLKYFVVDAFTDVLFGGNPAGVCLLEAPLPCEQMQQIAAENNLSETAFVCSNGGAYDLRWFTPRVEIDLCGHATLASAFVLHRFFAPKDAYCFHTQSGLLTVKPQGERFKMDFPARPVRPVAATAAMEAALGCSILEAHAARDLLLLLESEAMVCALQPDFAALARLPECHGVIVTARGSDKFDFVSRFFAPKMGIDEDPVTGSSHTELIPFWAARLGSNTLTARQASTRGGTLCCENHGARVAIAGQAKLYLTGEICV